MKGNKEEKCAQIFADTLEGKRLFGELHSFIN
jgi:hypothetical protein